MIQQLKDILDGELWIDENYKNKIDKLTSMKAMTKPLPQIVPYPDYWASNDELIKTGWSKLKKDFYESQLELISILEKKDDTFLNKKFSGQYTYKYLMVGLIHHDIYHLGQIGITIKLINEKNIR